MLRRPVEVAHQMRTSKKWRIAGLICEYASLPVTRAGALDGFEHKFRKETVQLSDAIKTATQIATLFISAPWLAQIQI